MTEFSSIFFNLLVELEDEKNGRGCISPVSPYTESLLPEL